MGAGAGGLDRRSVAVGNDEIAAGIASLGALRLGSKLISCGGGIRYGNGVIVKRCNGRIGAVAVAACSSAVGIGRIIGAPALKIHLQSSKFRNGL